MSSLQAFESEELARHEAVIARGFETFVEVGAALLTIREKRLYRDGFPTFEAYCREQWGMSRIHAHRLIGAASVVNNIVDGLLPIGDKPPSSLFVEDRILPHPETESQARPLARLEPELQREAWGLAVSSAPNGKPTAAQVEAAALAVSPPARKPPGPLPNQSSFLPTDDDDEPSEMRPRDDEDDEPSEMRPRDETEADRWAAVWNKKIGEWLDFAISLGRRGGIVNLSKHWPDSRKIQALEYLREFRDVSARCVTELEESL